MVAVYSCYEAKNIPPLNGAIRHTVWDHAKVGKIAFYPWSTPGCDRRFTRFRMLHYHGDLYLLFHCIDHAITAKTTAINGCVCEDSCIEYFFAPDFMRDEYFNFEVNCCGTPLLGFGNQRHHRMPISEAFIRFIKIVTSIPGITRSPDPHDKNWWVAIHLPVSTLFDVMKISSGFLPQPGQRWRANFYRCGGGVEYACWANIQTPAPDYHRPEQFGTILFL